MCGFDAAIEKKGLALNGAEPFCFLDYAESAGPTLRALSSRALPALGREGWGTRKNQKKQIPRPPIPESAADAADGGLGMTIRSSVGVVVK